MRWIIGTLLVLLVACGASKSEDAEQWYFTVEEAEVTGGVEDGDDKLIVFNLSGEVVTHPVGNFDSLGAAWRIDNSHMLMDIRVEDGSYEVWNVSPSDIQVLVRDIDDILQPIAYHHPHLVMTPMQPIMDGTPAWLINLDEGDVTTFITADIGSANICCRFSEDGETLEYLRYVPGADDAILELLARNIDSGDEQVLYTTADSTGAHTFYAGDPWVIQQRIRLDGRLQLTYQLVDPAGVITDIPIDNSGEIVSIRPFEGYLFSSYPTCETDCLYKLENIETGAEYTYMVGTVTDIPRPVYIYDENILIVNVDGVLMRLRVDVEPEILGYMPTLNMSVSDLTGRWALLVDSGDDPTTGMIWDYEADAALAFFPLDNGFYNAFVLDNWFVVANLVSGQLTTINTTTGDLVNWSIEREDVRLLTIASDVAAIVRANGEGDLVSGFYLYNREDNSFTLLMEGRALLYNPRNLADAVQ